MLRSIQSKRSAWTTLAVGGALVGLLVAGLGVAQDDSASSSRSFAGPPSFADVIEQVRPSVVTIRVVKEPVQLSSARGPAPFAGTPFDDMLERFGFDFGGQGWQFQTPMPRQGEGSGFIIDNDGYIATNNHVVDGASQVTVTLDSGEELVATVVGTDPRTDLALIKVNNGSNLPALSLGNSDAARVGDWVLAMGNPFGLGGTATAGIISARGRNINSGPYDDFLQVDAAINSGNSGGPIFNADGEVIGINTAIFSPNGGNIGIGFAIPANQARTVLDELKADGAVSRGWLGVEIRQVDRQNSPNADRLSDDEAGAEIARIVADGPADRAGLEAGDIITRFDGQAIDSPRTLSRLVGDLDSGDEVEIEYLRGDVRREVETVLGALQEAETRAAVPMNQRGPQDRYYRFEYPSPNQRFGR